MLGRPGEAAAGGGAPAEAALSLLRGPLQHAPDEGDADGLGLQGPGAGGVDTVGAPLLDQAQQGIDLAHLGPGQRDVEQGLGVGADGGAMAAAMAWRRSTSRMA